MNKQEKKNKFAGNEYTILHKVYLLEPVTPVQILTRIVNEKIDIAQSTIYETLDDLVEGGFIELSNPEEETRSKKAYRLLEKGRKYVERVINQTPGRAA